LTQTALLTGAGGFIGSHLAEALVRAGYRLRAFVHYNSRGTPGFLTDLPAEIQAEIELLAGDITDPAQWMQPCRAARPSSTWRL
jgi:nucleoside-diphosphate-sugar epimerase